MDAGVAPTVTVLDLHGSSLKAAEQKTLSALSRAIKENRSSFKIITGRGNHPNLNGSRALIFKRLPKWIENSEFCSRVKFLKKEVGAYEIHLHNASEKNIEVSSEKVTLELLGLTKLMKIIKSQKSQSEKQSEITGLLSTNYHLLRETCSGGITVFMVAALENNEEMMDFLLAQEKIFYIMPKLLKACAQNGYNTLIMAIVYGANAKTIDYLLNKAPSLLKQKDKQGHSVFEFVKKNQNPVALLEILYKHLEPRKREKGYTGLVREYKTLTGYSKLKSLKKERLVVIETQSLKRHQASHAWLSIDRMIKFVLYFTQAGRSEKSLKPYDFLREKLKVMKKIKSIFSADPLEVQTRKFKTLRAEMMGGLKKIPKFRELFLRFNNRDKTTPAIFFKEKRLLEPIVTLNKRPLIKFSNRKKLPVISGITNPWAPSQFNTKIILQKREKMPLVNVSVLPIVPEKKKKKKSKQTSVVEPQKNNASLRDKKIKTSQSDQSLEVANKSNPKDKAAKPILTQYKNQTNQVKKGSSTRNNYQGVRC